MKLNTLLVAVFFFFGLLLSSISLFAVYQFNTIAQPFHEEIPASIEHIKETSHLDGLAEFIRHYDEVLTQSARNYAFTGDVKWKERYVNIEPELDKIIKEAIAGGDSEDQAFFSSVDDANLLLVEMEYEAMELVDKGDMDSAVEILESDAYWEQKDAYAAALRSYVERRGRAYDEALMASTEAVAHNTVEVELMIEHSKKLIAGLIGIGLFLVVAAGLLLSLAISRPINTLTAKVDHISKGNLNLHLESSRIHEVQQLIDALNRILASMKLAIWRTGIKKEDIGIGKALAAKKKAEKQAHIMAQYPLSNPNTVLRLNKELDILDPIPPAGKALMGQAKVKDIHALLPKNIKKLISKVLKQRKPLVDYEYAIKKQKFILSIGPFGDSYTEVFVEIIPMNGAKKRS